MATTLLSLKTPKKEKSPIWLTISDGRDVNLKVYSNITILSKHWSKKKRCVLSANPKATEWNRYLLSFEKNVLDIYLRAKEENRYVTAAYIKRALEPKKNKKEDTFWNRWNEFLNSKKGSCSEGTIKKYNTVKRHLNAFEEYRKDLFSFNNINDVTLEELQYFMYHSRDLNTQTTSKNIKFFKAYLNWCHRRRYLNSTDFKYFIPNTQPDTLKIIITEDELNSLRELRINDTPHLENVRELFILSCLTGLRYSDYSRISKEHIKENNEEFYLQIRQKKTEQFIEIPLTEESKNIVMRLVNGKVHAISNQKINKYLKRVCQIAGIDELNEDSYYKGKEVTKTLKKKYELVTSHTGRRTFATNLLFRNVPSEIVMQFTGHKDYKSFSSYVNIPKQTQMNIVRNALIGKTMKIA